MANDDWSQVKAESLRASGATNRDIGQTFGVSETTVERRLGPKSMSPTPPPVSQPNAPAQPAPPGGPRPVTRPGEQPGAVRRFFRETPKPVLIIGGAGILALGYFIWRRYSGADEPPLEGALVGGALSGERYEYAAPGSGFPSGGGTGGEGVEENDMLPIWLTGLGEEITSALAEQSELISRLTRPSTNAPSSGTNSASSQHEKRVREAYRDILGRDPDKKGLNYWIEQLRGGMSEKELKQNLSGSPEAKRSLVRRTYRRLLGRTPDRSGLDYWADQLSSGMSESELEKWIKASEEYKRKA